MRMSATSLLGGLCGREQTLQRAVPLGALRRGVQVIDAPGPSVLSGQTTGQSGSSFTVMPVTVSSLLGLVTTKENVSVSPASTLSPGASSPGTPFTALAMLSAGFTTRTGAVAVAETSTSPTRPVTVARFTKSATAVARVQ